MYQLYFNRALDIKLDNNGSYYFKDKEEERKEIVAKDFISEL